MRTLKISSLPSVKVVPWLDRDYIMLHACFQLLVDAVEKEDVLDTWCVEKYGEDLLELDRLYHWWKEYIKVGEPCYMEKDVQGNLEKLIKLREYLWS